MLPPPIARAALAVYTAALLTATHWPELTVHGPVSRTDLIIHFGVFFAWGVLCVLATPKAWPRGRAVARCMAIGLAFAALDETTQPLFGRIFDWADLGADAAGVACGVALAAAVLRRSAGDGAR